MTAPGSDPAPSRPPTVPAVPAAPAVRAVDVLHTEVLPLTRSEDVVRTRHRVRELVTSHGCDLVLQTKVVTAASELARNTLLHGGGGEVTLELLRPAAAAARTGLAMTFVDTGPGIPDLDMAMTGGWSSGSGLGLGLPGSRRLVHEFDVATTPGVGTRVRAVVWWRPR